MTRDRHEIVMKILKEAESGKRRTELMLRSGLSSKQSKEYFGMLLKEGLLAIDKNGLFKTTKKGLNFLKKCSNCILFAWTKQG
jgi:predicted transcriptional regulator